MTEDYDLARFVTAQDSVMTVVKSELLAGRKRSHWMWFVFPQLAGLGTSAMAKRYAIGSLAEAGAYLGHPLLGDRLLACTELVLAQQDRTAHEIFGSPDDLKFRSSMTLFAPAAAALTAPAPPVFARTLGRFFRAGPDPRTLELLAARPG